MKKLKGLLTLLRPELPFSAGVCVVLGQLFALGKFGSAAATLKSFSSIFVISASILVFNDYIDVETDRINAPHRPIPSNAVTSSETLALSIVLLMAGLLLGCLINIIAFVSAAMLAVVGFLYNVKFKKSGLPGNMMVSFSVGMTFIYGGFSVGRFYSKTAWFFGIIAALIDLGEEIAADAMDAEGDRLIGSRSLAIMYGRKTALAVSESIFLLVIFLSAVPFVLRWFPPLYLGPILIMDGAIGYYAFHLWSSDNEQGRKHIRRLYLGAAFGLLMFLAMRLVGV